MLAEAVRARRDELGLTRSEVADRAKAAGETVSYSTLGEIEGGRRYDLKPSVVRALAAGLDWDPGHIRALLRGEPPPATPATTTGDLEAKIAELVREQVAQVTGTQPPDPKHDDITAVMRLFEMFTPEQRRVFLEAARRFQEAHGEPVAP